MPATVPLAQFAQAQTHGWELHRIGNGWWAVRRDESTGFQRLLGFPACHPELPSPVRKLFADAVTCRAALQNDDRCGRCGEVGRCSCVLDFVAKFNAHPMIGGRS